MLNDQLLYLILSHKKDGVVKTSLPDPKIITLDNNQYLTVTHVFDNNENSNIAFYKLRGAVI